VKRSLHRFVLRVFGIVPWPLQRFLIGRVKAAYVAGASAVVTSASGQILLVRHSYKAGWSTPGGFLNRGEQAADAVVREVWEELGLRVSPFDEPVVVLRSHDRIVEFVQQVRLIDEAAGARVKSMSAEIDDARWFDPHDLPELAKVTRRALEELDAVRERRNQT
jgi:ADP-ribose pyrophosphatase YjhB (NUDIX family)